MQTNQPQAIFKDLIFGTRPVIEALESGKEINKILIQRGAANDSISTIIKLARNLNVPVQRVPPEKLVRVTRKNHQGVIAFLSPVVYDNLETVVPTLYEEGQQPLIVVLDRITDVRNLGAICRSAECLGAQVIVIPEQGGAALNADAIKTSAGAIFNLKVCRVKNLYSSIQFLKNSGLKVIACTEKSPQSIYDSDLAGPCCVVMGAEDTGIHDDLLKITDVMVSIPMVGQTASLNVSVSAGIVLSEVLKQRTAVETKAQ